MHIIRQHLPLITSRIEFSFCPHPPLPEITLRQDFLSYIHSAGDNVNQVESDNMVNGLCDDVDEDLDDDVDGVVGEGVGEDMGEDVGDIAMNDAATSNINAGIGDHFVSGTSLIPKPPGEPGRPQSGGFNLEATLGWPKSTIQNIIKYVHSQASIHLDISKSFAKQSKEKIDQVCISTALHYPIVSKYEDLWPIRSILKLHLKSTSEIARRTRAKATTKRIKKAIRKQDVESEDDE